MPIIVMGSSLRPTGSHRQHRLAPLQSLHLSLLIDAQYQGVARRIDIKAHDVADFLHKTWIGRKRKGFGAMRLQAKSPPDATHTLPGQAAALSHVARAP